MAVPQIASLVTSVRLGYDALTLFIIITMTNTAPVVLDVEQIRIAIEVYNRLMAVDVRTVELYENGIKLDIPQQRREEWLFTGLGLPHFIETDFYKTGFTEVDQE